MRVRSIVLTAAAAGAAATGAAALAAPALTAFLLRAGEETGFAPHGDPQVYRTVRGYLAGERGSKGYKADVRRLTAAGFAGAARQDMAPVGGGQDAAGLSLVIELRSAGAARKDARVELDQAIASQGKARIRRFSVRGVPGARGFTATAPGHPGGAANAVFTEGRCVLLVGDSVPSGDIAGPVKAGVGAIHGRTGGRCP